MVVILDEVLRDIEAQIAVHAPERGGALLGMIDRPVITEFLYDELAKTSRCHYQTSRQLAGQVQSRERLEPIEFKGILHSHPGSLDRPSAQDEREFATGLRVNPHMPYYIAPIVTQGRTDAPLSAHEIALQGGKVSFYLASRTRNQRVCIIRQTAVRALPLRHDLELLRARYGGAEPEISILNIAGLARLCGHLTLPGGLEMHLIVNEAYPVEPPLCLLTPAGGAQRQAELPWRLETPAAQRLVSAFSNLFEGAPARLAYGPSGGSVYTEDADRAALAGWEARYTDREPHAVAIEARDSLYARSVGLLSEGLQHSRVLIAGLGSVGSYAGEQLVRAGIGGVTLIDPETVEEANLSRTVYDLQGVGQAKTDALTRRLLNINPLLEVERHRCDLRDLTPDALNEMVQRSDIVIAATDDLQAQQALNHRAYALGKPALFIGLYAGARGGEIVFCVPEKTPCYLCATRLRHTVQQEGRAVRRQMDYGTGRLVGEMALAADIQHVTSCAVKMALSLLSPSVGELNKFLQPQIAAGTNYLTLSMAPDYWFYPQVFQETPGQFAYQSVWLTPERWEECAVCGSHSLRTGPEAVALRAPCLAALSLEIESEGEVAK